MEQGNTNLKVLIAFVLILGTLIVTSAQVGGGGIGITTGSSAGSSATTATTATTSSTSSTSSTSGSGGDVPIVSFITRVEEKRNVNSYYFNAPSTTVLQDTNRHVVRIKIKCTYSMTTGTNSLGPYEDHVFMPAIAVPSGVEINPIDQSSPILQVNTQPGVQCLVNYAPGTISYTPGLGSSPATWYTWVERGTAATNISAGTIKYYYYTYSATKQYYYNGNPPQWIPNTATNGWYLADLVADKVELTTISTDSRRVYGKANLDGELPGDPNAELSTNNFQPWTFKGGHFVGNMVYGSSKDQSGTARTQFKLTTPTDAQDYLAACLTLFATGQRGTFSTGNIGLYRPGASDPNLNQGLNTIWDTRYNIDTAYSSPPTGDFSKQPYYTVTPDTTNGTEYGQNQYLNWQIPYSNYVWQTAYGGSGSAGDDDMWTHFALCSNSESSTTWQYFSSAWNEAISGQVFPLSDSRPRVWKIRYN